MPMTATKNIIAVDLGASSGRVMSGEFDGHKIALKEQYRFANRPVQIHNRLYWDYLKIFQEIKYGLSIAQNDLGQLASMSIDTWGVDYGMISAHDEVLFAPHSYRDDRVEAAAASFAQKIAPAELFRRTGVQPANINTNLQLLADLQRYPFLPEQVQDILMMPDLIGFFFSGQRSHEFTIASTAGLVNAESQTWDAKILRALGIPTKWFGPLTVGGQLLGPLVPQIVSELHLNPEMQVITGAGHDTAAGVLATPRIDTAPTHTAFISSGTWSIVGQGTAQPITSTDAFNAGLTNEGGFFGDNNLLKNITGLWIVQELQREWQYLGTSISFDQLTQDAIAARSIGSTIDPNDPVFSTPGEMEEKIIRYLTQTNQHLPQTRGELIRVVLESLAHSYQQVLTELEEVTGQPVKAINMFGGGIQNRLLVQLTADYTHRPVVTGPVEASVLGNMLTQLHVLGELSPNDWDNVIKQSVDIHTVQPISL